TLPGGTLNRCHNIYIDEFGYAYLAGCNLNNGGMIILDCFTNPGTPEFVTNAPNTYAHDVYTRDNKMYASEINAGVFTIYDVTDKENIVDLGNQETPFSFTHNAWLSDDGNYLFTTDELANAPVAAYDVSDPSDIQFLDSYAPFTTLGDGVIPHNVHVWQNWVIVSYYTDGCIILDATYPDNLVEVGNFDTYIPASTGFQGVWGAYPFLPSGLVLCTDIGNGLYVLEPNYVQACYLHGDVTDAATGAAIPGAKVTIVSTPTFANTDALGEFKTGIATSDTYEVKVSKPGYVSETVSAEMINGEITTISVQLTAAIPFTLSGNVVEEGTNTPLSNINVKIFSDFYDFNLNSDANGNFTINDFYTDDYQIVSAEWGYLTTGFSRDDLTESNSNLTIELQEGYEDVFCFDLGWTVSGDADTGPWERGLPIAVSGGGADITPGIDSDDLGPDCYVTGIIDDLYDGVLINGDTTTLTSPIFDLSDYQEPMLTYNYWFLNFNINSQTFGPDRLIVKLTNGTDTVTIFEHSNAPNFNFGWFQSDIFNIAEYIEPSDNMTFSITASASVGQIITEAGLDHFLIWDDNSVAVDNPVDENYQMSIYPNPSASDFNMNYSLTDQAHSADLVIYNTLGQMVKTMPLDQNGVSINFGGELPKGFYFAQIQQNNGGSPVIKIIKE
ncbi:MAG: hypothetical protein ACI9XB_004885, partial [Gammaproteobacteria bacterium]